MNHHQWLPALGFAALAVISTLASAQDSPFGPIRGATAKHAAHQDGKWILEVQRDTVGDVTIDLPTGARAYVLPIAAGVYVQADDAELMDWLRGQSPLGFTEALTVPFVAVRYQDTQWVYALPDPYYATAGVNEAGDLSIIWTATPNRVPATTTVEAWPVTGSPVDAALSVRGWLQRRGQWRSLKDKIANNPKVDRLLGAAHFYLFGDGVFSVHDVRRTDWPKLAAALRDADADTPLGRIRAGLGDESRAALAELTDAQWPSLYAKKTVAHAIAVSLRQPGLAGPSGDVTPLEAVNRNRAALARQAQAYLANTENWGDGASLPMLDLLRDAGIDRAVLLTNDFDVARFSPHVAAEADRRGYLFGPYDSYGSIHPPDLASEQTWSTAQFDQTLYGSGMIVRADGTPMYGFKKIGHRLSPIAAWPWVQRRVNERLTDVPNSAWFLDVDAFGEFFDDYHPDHPASKPDDADARRQRMAWLSEHHGLVVGSEGASAVMTGPLHFAHGVQTPYYGWGDERLKDHDSPYGLGRWWPADTPGVFFKPTTVLPDYRRPWFTPTDRLPLFAAVFGDAVVATHHWQNGSLKYPDESTHTALTELLYNVPPLVHINRETWKDRGPIVARRFAFQSPLHRQLATAPLVAFDWLSDDRLLQRTTYRTDRGGVMLIANFADQPRGTYPAQSLTVEGPIDLSQRVFHP